MIRVAISSSMPALRAGLRALLHVDELIEVVEDAAGSPEPGRQRPVDVVVMVAEGGWPWQDDLLIAGEEAPAVLLLSNEAIAALPAVAASRPWGLLPLEASAEELTAAVRALNAGLVVGTPGLLAPLLQGRTVGQERALEPLAEPLTAREVEVLGLLAEGLANKQIAAALRISEHTVKFHVSAIYAKLGATNRTEAVRLGAARGLIVL